MVGHSHPSSQDLMSLEAANRMCAEVATRPFTAQ
jgi:hypothetical protein